MSIDVLYQDHRAVEEDAEVHCPHGEEVRRDTGVVEPDEGCEQRERHGHRDGDRPPDRAQEEPQHQHDQRRTLEQVVRDGVERGVDETRSVVEGDDLHPLGRTSPLIRATIL